MERVQFWSTKNFNFWVVLKKGSILWVVFKKEFKSFKKYSKSFESYWKKVQFFESDKNKSSTLIEKRFIKEAQLNESFTKSSIIWVIVEKNKRVQFFESFFQTRSRSKKWVQFLWVMLKKGFNFYESCWKKRSILWVVFEKGVQFCEWNSEKINSWSHFFFWKIFFKRFKSVSFEKKNSLSFFFWWEKTKSLNHVIKKGSILRVILKKIFETYWKEVQFFVSYFWEKLNSLSRFFFFDKNSKIQFFESHSKKKKTILWVMLKRFQFFESFFWKKSSVLLVTLKKFNFLSYIQRRFNSLSHFFFFEKSSNFWFFFWVRFFESYSKKGSILWVIFPDRINHFCESKFL